MSRRSAKPDGFRGPEDQPLPETPVRIGRDNDLGQVSDHLINSRYFGNGAPPAVQ
jgi:hypothetical protein